MHRRPTFTKEREKRQGKGESPAKSLRKAGDKKSPAIIMSIIPKKKKGKERGRKGKRRNAPPTRNGRNIGMKRGERKMREETRAEIPKASIALKGGKKKKGKGREKGKVNAGTAAITQSAVFYFLLFPSRKVKGGKRKGARLGKSPAGLPLWPE